MIQIITTLDMEIMYAQLSYNSVVYSVVSEIDYDVLYEEIDGVYEGEPLWSIDITPVTENTQDMHILRYLAKELHYERCAMAQEVWDYYDDKTEATALSD